LPKRKLPILKPAEVVTRLVTLGFEEVRQKRVAQAVSSRGRTLHDGSISQWPGCFPILLRQIARDIRITAEELVDA